MVGRKQAFFFLNEVRIRLWLESDQTTYCVAMYIAVLFVDGAKEIVERPRKMTGVRPQPELDQTTCRAAMYIAVLFVDGVTVRR
mmetsp:Transcript_24845/g.44736  ORF Transcript_24845/g.44736 Transcript_24845/m.44736 type:complete len:84 (+) Transcript_24845:1021-1272(+)